MINPVAIVTGSSRGIGRSIAHKLASMNYNVVLAAKSTKDTKDLPGTIYSVADEIEKKYNVDVLPIPTDLRKDEDISNLVKETNTTAYAGITTSTIFVSNTTGFPDNYGLIKINDEVIT